MGCMPACAQFLSPGARASTLFRSLRSRLLGSRRAGTGTGKTTSSKLSLSYEQKRGQFGGGSDESKQILDYEMTDTQPRLELTTGRIGIASPTTCMRTGRLNNGCEREVEPTIHVGEFVIHCVYSR